MLLSPDTHFACIKLGCLTHEQVPGNQCALVYTTSQCPPMPSEWVSLHLAAEQPHRSACKVPPINKLKKVSPFLVAHMLKNVADLTSKLPDAFEI